MSEPLTAAALAELALYVEVDACDCGAPGAPAVCLEAFSGKPQPQRCKKVVPFTHRERLVRALRLLELVEERTPHDLFAEWFLHRLDAEGTEE